MKGQVVVAKEFNGNPIVRRVWTVGANTVFISDEQNFAKLAGGIPALEPVGFPIDDVFDVPRGITEREMQEKHRRGELDWSTMRQWRPGRI